MNKNEELRKKIIENLVLKRKEKNISQFELAKLMNIKTSNLCRIESGKQNITLDTFLNYCNSIGNDPADFIADISYAYKSDNNNYVLKIYDDVLIEFKYNNNNIIDIVKVNKKLKHLIPIDLDISSDGLYNWISSRTIPNNRRFMKEILEAYNLDFNNKKAIIDVCLGLSLNDSYWITPKDFDGLFSKYNLYENPLDDILSFVAYTGHVYNNKNKVFTTSPEFTTGGVLRKTWHRDEDGILYLYKTGSEGFSNSGNEPYSEFFAYQIASKMGLDAVKYDVVNYKGLVASKCEIFTNIDTSFIPIGNIVKKGGIEACVDYCDTLGKGFSNAIRSMIVFDALIYNEDRHFGNFGLLRDNKTGEIISFAPLFDNGLSLFALARKQDYEKDKSFKQYALTRFPPYGLTYKQLCKKYMTTLQKSQLRRLINFKFERKTFIEFDNNRIEAIEKQIQFRINELLNL